MDVNYLNEEEILLIEAFWKNQKMVEAVRKVLLQPIYSHGVMEAGLKHNPFKNRAIALVAGNDSNEDLGSKVRSWWEAINALEEGFGDLGKIKSNKAEAETPAINEGV